MSQPQSAIIPHSGRYGSFISLRLNGTVNPITTVRAVGHRLASMTADIRAEYNDSNLVASIAFGSNIWQKLAQTMPQQLKPFKTIGQGAVSATAGEVDLFFHCHSNAVDINFLLCQNLLAALSDSVSVINETQGFLFLDNRDLTGFIDGTENPEEEQERCDVALIGSEDIASAGGSYVLAMRFIHDLDRWQKLDVSAQENIIGRTKVDSVELNENSLPDTAHISRVVIEEKGEELEILRHSMPYGTASGDKGLFFLSYSRRLDIYEKMLAHMYGESGDGLHDHLMDFSHAPSGSYFFAPSQTLLNSWGK
ncbi:MAG: Dyp-type peroxidase [Gammaproteobacteria bacterium]|nr:Dyp-type peroxidase [Gammaproteobacteria bacterium]